MIGGVENTEKFGIKVRADTFKFSIKSGRFTSGPMLRHARYGASSCVLNGKLYAVAGGDGSELLSSIEQLDIENNKRNWKLIDLPAPFTPRLELMVSPLNETQLLIAGGSKNKDAIVLDQSDMIPRLIKTTSQGSFNCFSRSVMIKQGVVITVDSF